MIVIFITVGIIISFLLGLVLINYLTIHPLKMSRYLIISSFDLYGYEDKKSAVITVSDFEPPRRASMKEKE